MDELEGSEHVTAFVEFCFLANRQERLAFLRNQPELLSPGALVAIKARIQDSPHDEEAEHFTLLEDYASRGPSALEGFCSSTELTLLFAQFCEGFQSFEERQAFLERHPALLSDKAATVVERFIAECRTNALKRFVSKYALYRNLLHIAREEGIPRAFEEYGVASAEVIAAVNTLLNPENAAGWLGACQVLARNRLGARKAFNYLRVKHESNEAGLKRVEAAYASVSDILAAGPEG